MHKLEEVLDTFMLLESLTKKDFYSGAFLYSENGKTNTILMFLFMHHEPDMHIIISACLVIKLHFFVSFPTYKYYSKFIKLILNVYRIYSKHNRRIPINNLLNTFVNFCTRSQLFFWLFDNILLTIYSGIRNCHEICSAVGENIIYKSI